MFKNKIFASLLLALLFVLPKVQAAPSVAKVGVANSNAAEQEGLAEEELDTLIQHLGHGEGVQFSRPKEAASGEEDVDSLLENAMQLLGIVYRFGGSSREKGFDCSGFMQYIFRQTLGITLPRTSAEMAKVGVPVARNDLQPGDMVFFATHGKRISHVGLYMGAGKMIHAPRTGKNIEVSNINTNYWRRRYVTARRVGRAERAARFLQ